jgi:hypothetical protein
VKVGSRLSDPFIVVPAQAETQDFSHRPWVPGFATLSRGGDFGWAAWFPYSLKSQVQGLTRPSATLRGSVGRLTIKLKIATVLRFCKQCGGGT